MNKKKVLSMLLAGTFGMSTVLTGCGGGGGTDNPVADAIDPGSNQQAPVSTAEPVSGVVADGYLNGAKVCLDVNLNKACDETEPSVFSGAGGQYTIAVEELAKLPEGTTADDFPILVEVKPEYNVMDEVDGDGTPVTKEYILSAPKGKPEFVSPITTLIHEEMESSVEEITPEKAEENVKARIGVADDIDLFEDYIAPNTEGMTEEQAAERKEKMETVHMVAQVVANTMGDMKAQLDKVEGMENISLDVIIKAVVNEVMNRLESIVTQVEAAKEDIAAGTVTKFNPEDVVAKVEESEGAFDGDKAKEAVAVAEMEKATAKSSFKTVLEKGGSSWLELHFDYDEETQQEIPELEIGTVKLDAQGALSEEEMAYNFAAGVWGDAVQEDDNSFILTANGWISVNDGPEAYDMTFDENGSVLLTRKADGLQEILTVAEADLAGKYQGHFSGRLGRFLVDPTLVFPEGAKGHKLSFTRTADTYEIWDDEWNTVRIWDGQNETLVTSLDQMLIDFAYNPEQQGGNDLGVGRDLSARFEKIDDNSGILHLFIWEPCAHQPKKLMEQGAWKRVTPFEGGPEIILVDIPGAYAFKYGDREERPFFAEKDGVVKYGNYIPAGVQDGMDELMYNPVAMDGLKGNLNYEAIATASPMENYQEPVCNEPYPGDPNMGGEPHPGDPNMGGEPYPGDPNMGGEPYPGDPNMGGEPYPGDPNMGGEPYPGDPNMGGEPYPTPVPPQATIPFDAQMLSQPLYLMPPGDSASHESIMVTFNSADGSLVEDGTKINPDGVEETWQATGNWEISTDGVLMMFNLSNQEPGFVREFSLVSAYGNSYEVYFSESTGQAGYVHMSADPYMGGEPYPGDPNMGGEPVLVPEPAPETIVSFDAQQDLMGKTFAFVDSKEVCVMTFKADGSLSEACREEFDGMIETMANGGTWQLDGDGVLHGQFEGDYGTTKVFKLNDSSSSVLSLYIEDWEGDVLKYNTYEQMFVTTPFNDPAGMDLVGLDGVALSFSTGSGQFTDPSGESGFFDYILESDGSLRMYMENGDVMTMFLMAEGATTMDFPVVGFIKDAGGNLVDVVKDHMTANSL